MQEAKTAFGRKRAKDFSELDAEVLDYDEKYFEDYDTDSLLSKIECPSLLIYGNQELGGILSQNQVQRMMSKMPSLVPEYMEKSGHAPQRTEAGATFALISDFIESTD